MVTVTGWPSSLLRSIRASVPSRVSVRANDSDPDARIDRSKLLGQPVTVTIPTQNLLTPRYINGKVTRVAVSAVELTGTRYAVYRYTA